MQVYFSYHSPSLVFTFVYKRFSFTRLSLPFILFSSFFFPSSSPQQFFSLYQHPDLSAPLSHCLITAHHPRNSIILRFCTSYCILLPPTPSHGYPPPPSHPRPLPLSPPANTI